VSLALRSLELAGLVREASQGPDGPSYGAVFFEPVPDAAFVLGLDLGSRFLRGAVADLAGRIRARQDVELRGGRRRRRTRSDHDVARFPDRSRGVAAGGASTAPCSASRAWSRPSSETLRLTQPHIAGLEGRPFGSEVRERVGVPVTVDNDVNLAAVGERWTGVARGVDDFAFLSIGTGTGLGLVLGGELHRGTHGAAGEIDWALAGSGEELDPSAEGVSALATEVSWPGGVDGSTPPYDARNIFTAARRGDSLARSVVDVIARRIAAHIAPVAAVADPELVVLGGGLGMNGDLLLEPVRALLREWLPYPPARRDLEPRRKRGPDGRGSRPGCKRRSDNVFVSRRAVGSPS
jgi:predicted NBD/HSP70 family sugar kinase